MRTVTFGVACSLDGFIAREDHSVDWLIWSDDVQAITTQFWKTIDTVVMGRKTYDVAGRGGGSGIPLFLAMRDQIRLEQIECRPLKKGCVYVLYRVKSKKAAKTPG